MRRLRVALAAPLFIPLPAQKYGGTERVVSYLADALSALGHDVTVSCSGDSTLPCRMLHPINRAIWSDPGAYHEIPSHLLQMQQLIDKADEFDIIHLHNGFWQFMVPANVRTPVMTTFHCRLDRRDLPELISRTSATGLISISDNQRSGYTGQGWLGTVHNGIPTSLYSCTTEPEGYLAYIGRLSREKGCEDAVRIALKSGHPLKIAGAPDKSPAGLAYFESVIRPLLSQPGIEYVGELGDAQKQDFLGHASALLMPISWPEPFGLVMIEAMATGTPVLAYRAGSVPEIIEDGVTGHIVKDEHAAVDKLPALFRLDRQQIRRRFEQRFTAQIMAEKYLTQYRQLTGATA